MCRARYSAWIIGMSACKCSAYKPSSQILDEAGEVNPMVEKLIVDRLIVDRLIVGKLMLTGSLLASLLLASLLLASCPIGQSECAHQLSNVHIDRLGCWTVLQRIAMCFVQVKQSSFRKLGKKVVKPVRKAVQPLRNAAKPFKEAMQPLKSTAQQPFKKMAKPFRKVVDAIRR